MTKLAFALQCKDLSKQYEPVDILKILTPIWRTDWQSPDDLGHDCNSLGEEVTRAQLKRE